MAKLAIKGHPTRGSEVIALLEMLGGKNINTLGVDTLGIYLISTDGTIEVCYTWYTQPENYVVFTLEEFEEKFPYKVGDKIVYKLKPNQIFTIEKAHWDGCEIAYVIGNEDEVIIHAYTKELQSYKEETMETITIDDFKANTKEWLIDKLQGMIISDAIRTIGNIHDELHKPKYPKTYEECCEVLKIPNDERYIDIDVPLNYNKLLSAFTKLLICRDAYWRIAGEQMGLGKPWEPDWENENEYKYGLFRLKNIIYKDVTCIIPALLIFPTFEMRDAFYENFKDLIKAIKELL